MKTMKIQIFRICFWICLDTNTHTHAKLIHLHGKDQNFGCLGLHHISKEACKRPDIADVRTDRMEKYVGKLKERVADVTRIPVFQ